MRLSIDMTVEHVAGQFPKCPAFQPANPENVVFIDGMNGVGTELPECLNGMPRERPLSRPCGAEVRHGMINNVPRCTWKFGRLIDIGTAVPAYEMDVMPQRDERSARLRNANV